MTESISDGTEEVLVPEPTTETFGVHVGKIKAIMDACSEPLKLRVYNAFHDIVEKSDPGETGPTLEDSINRFWKAIHQVGLTASTDPAARPELEAKFEELLIDDLVPKLRPLTEEEK